MNINRRSFLSGLTGAGIVADFDLSSARAADGLEIGLVSPWEFRSIVPRETGNLLSRPGVTETLAISELDGTIVPYLAKRWSASDDVRTWRIELREGVTFHDGTPLDARAVVESMRRLVPTSLYLKDAGITSIEQEGETVVLRTAEPFAPLPSYLCDNTVPILSRASFNEKDEVTRAIGTGPFKIESLDLPRFMKLARNEAYRGPKSQAARVNYHSVPNGETRANMAIAGDADVILNVPTPSVARIAATGRMRIDRVIVPRVHMLMPNIAMPQFADVRVRRALSAAIDRTAIATAIMRNAALAGTQYLPPTLKGWHQPDLAPLPFDTALANRLLDESGWPRGADGIRAKDGKRFAGTVRTFVNRPELPVIATTLQAQFREVGFDLAIRVGEWTEITQGQWDGTLELGLSSRSLVILPDPITTIVSDFTRDKSPAGGNGATNWVHQGMRDAVKAYTQTVDETRKTELRRRIATILHEELPLIPITWYDQIIAVRRDVSGFVNDPYEQRYFLERMARTV